MNKYDFLVQDPRPDSLKDSHLWVKLLRSAITLPDLEMSYVLSTRLWSLRYAGTTIARSHYIIKFAPVLEPEGEWESQEYFEEIKRKYILPYADDIKKLLDKLI